MSQYQWNWSVVLEQVSGTEEFYYEWLVAGLGWGDAKQRLFAQIDAEIGPMRERYEQLMANPERIELILQEGAAKAASGPRSRETA